MTTTEVPSRHDQILRDAQRQADRHLPPIRSVGIPFAALELDAWEDPRDRHFKVRAGRHHPS